METLLLFSHLPGLPDAVVRRGRLAHLATSRQPSGVSLPAAKKPSSRDIHVVGDRAAHLLAMAFLDDTVETCAAWLRQKVAVDQNRRLVFCVDGSVDDPLWFDRAGRARARVELQRGATWAERIQNAVDDEMERGARAVCAISSETPTLPLHLLDHAFRALMFERAVVGPTVDGGAWLVGCARPAPPAWLAGFSWSSSGTAAGHVLPFWYDVEVGDDLWQLRWHTGIEPQLAPHSRRVVDALYPDLVGGQP